MFYSLLLHKESLINAIYLKRVVKHFKQYKNKIYIL